MQWNKLSGISFGLRHLIIQYSTFVNAITGRSKFKSTYIALDILLGCLTFIVVNRFLHEKDFSGDVINLASIVKEWLDELLEWLMGAPAGLKLNNELSYFLGNFFIYHVEIWMTYLLVIKWYLPIVALVVTCSNLFGVSIFFCFLVDVVTMLTFHLYCFYVYAAKLYHVQLKTLISLARLFRGKKWNVLRLRIDSVTFQADQLILGTILFTILLFLLPTTALYYVVFSTIHLILLAIKSSLLYFVQILTTRLQRLDEDNKVDESNHETETSTCWQRLRCLLGKLLQGDLINLQS